MKRRYVFATAIIAILILAAVLFFTKTSSQNIQQETKKFYCDNASRTAFCGDVGDRVCGWLNQSVKCLKYPCALNFDLRCQACKNQEVEYYTFGACPAG